MKDPHEVSEMSHLESAAREIIRLGENATERPFSKEGIYSALRYFRKTGPDIVDLDLTDGEMPHRTDADYIAHTANHAVELAKSWLEMREELDRVTEMLRVRTAKLDWYDTEFMRLSETMYVVGKGGQG